MIAKHLVVCSDASDLEMALTDSEPYDNDAALYAVGQGSCLFSTITDLLKYITENNVTLLGETHWAIY